MTHKSRAFDGSPQGGKLRRLAQAALLLKVAVALVVFDAAAADAFVLPKSAIGHALSVALVGLLALCVWSRAVAVGWSWMLVWVSALTLAFAVATPFALDTTVALFGVDRRFLGLTHMADAFVIFLSVALLFGPRRDLRVLVGALVGATLVVVTYGLLQTSGHDVVTFNEGTLRPIATFGQPDTMGAYAGIAAITSLIFAGSFWQTVRPVGRGALVATTAGCFVIAYADGARAALVAVAAGTLAALLLYLVGSRRRLSRWHFGVPVLLILGTGLVLTSPLASRISPERLATDPSLSTRLEIWQASARMIAGRPLLGVGPDNFAVGYPAARSDATVQLDGLDVSQTSTHSWPVYMLTSGGLAAGVALGGALIAAVTGAVRLRREGSGAAFALVPLAAYVGQGLVTITDPAVDWVVWLSFGVIAGGMTHKSTLGRTVVLRRVAGGVAVASLILLIPAVGDAWTRIRASEIAGQSQSLLSVARPLDAVAAAREATRLDARRGNYWGRFGTALSAAGSPSGARTAYTEASLREPWQPLWPRNVGLQWLALGDLRRATDALLEAIRLDPHDAVSFDVLARLAVNSGDDMTAAKYGDRAIGLFPGRVSFYDAPVLAHQRLNEWASAERDIRIGLVAVGGQDQAHLHILLGRLLVRTGRIAEANLELEWLVSRGVDNPDVQAFRAELSAPSR